LLDTEISARASAILRKRQFEPEIILKLFLIIIELINKDTHFKEFL